MGKYVVVVNGARFRLCGADYSRRPEGNIPMTLG
jgi:hypothetical protein